jgi:predicted alpha-1,2-mannosidase
MKVGISYVSIKQARLNLETEIPDWNFDAIVTESKIEWNDLLSRIKISGGTQEDHVRFYTDLWHSLLGRKIISDVNGKYPDYTGRFRWNRKLPKNENGAPDFAHYNSDGLWGAQWTLNTLWHLVYPEVTSDFVKSFLQYYKDGGLIPRGPSGGNYTYVMVGASSTPFIVSAYMKGIRDFDIELAYKGLKKNHMPGGIMSKAGYEHGTNVGGGLENYIKLGYAPYPLGRKLRAYHIDGVGQTLEYAYQDWTLAQLAKELDKTEDYNYFMERSLNYQNLYDRQTGYMRPMDRSGQWKRNFDPFEYGNGFVESNAAQATWFVPHDYDGLAKLMGGKDIMVARLDSAFREAAKLGFTSGKSHDVERQKELSRIPVNYGNQPSTQTAFIFNVAGSPHLTQKWSRMVVDSVYRKVSPYDGYNGDEDQGQMGALAVLMKIGLFQLDGGTTSDPIYQIGSPVFDEIEIELNPDYYEGDKFIIETINNSKDNIYIKSASLNGQPLDRFYLKHSEIVRGGRLVLEMNSRQD